jgi:hypothetical protein
VIEIGGKKYFSLKELTNKESGHYCGSRSSLLRRIKEGRLMAQKNLNGELIVSEEAIVNFIKKNPAA